MITKQLKLLDAPQLTSAGVIIKFEHGVDLSTVDLRTQEQDIVVEKGKYIIYPTGETHPYGDQIKSLSGSDFPYIIGNYNHKTSIVKPYVVPSIDYPRITLKTIEGRNFHILFHRLVGRSFFQPPENMSWKEADRFWVFHHDDGRKWDYRIKNLFLKTQKENLETKSAKMDHKKFLKQAELKGLF